MTDTWTISNLRDVPRYVDTVASRGWHAWWTDSPVPLAEYRNWVQACIESTGVPACFVAYSGEQYLGSVKLIASDLEARPQYTPWIAALWVDEAFRRQGIAARLIDAARAEAGLCGHKTAYLCATPENSPYYLARGWKLLEEAVSGLNIFTIPTVSKTAK
jgi:GNAT superfamily N-acetyltransferase